MAEDMLRANGGDLASANRIQQQLHARKRKRTQTRAAAAILYGSSSSGSSDDEEDETSNYSSNAFLTKYAPSMTEKSRGQEQIPKRNTHQPEGWRVKLYRLNADGSWDDCGTGRIVCMYKTTSNMSGDFSPHDQVYHELGEPTLCMHAEATPARVLLRTKILLRDAYQRQGDNIITWCEPYFEDSSSRHQNDGQPQGVDLALSFQDNAGCLDIWRQITQVQSRAADWFRSRGVFSKPNAVSAGHSGITEHTPTVTDMAHAVAAAHHANLQRQQQHAMWVNVASEASQQHYQHPVEEEEDTSDFRDHDAEAVAASMAAAAAAGYGGGCAGTELPYPPTLQNLEEIADLIAAAQALPQRDELSLFVAKDDCSYLKAMLQLFEPSEARQDYGALATLAACIKTILLLNDPPTIDFIVNDEEIYERVCASLEYDPDLRDKANHRWFLRERAKFRTVVLMEDKDLINAIQRSFRVTYLRDTLLRPTMDESSLSILASMQTFTHAEVVKGVTSPIKDADVEGDSYLVRVMRTLGKEVRAISEIEWMEIGKQATASRPESPESIVVGPDSKSSSAWKQHLAPQDDSLPSRKLRRRGCLSFFRELFNMVRVSLQQSDKDDFYAAIVFMEVHLNPAEVMTHDPSRGHLMSEAGQASAGDTETVNLLSILGAVLADPIVDATEKVCVLEIIGSIAMHDPSHIRRHALEYQELGKRTGGKEDMITNGRPSPNERRQILFKCPANDLIASLLFVLAVETDAGLLLHTTEILRTILDTDMLGDHGPIGTGLNVDDNDLIPHGMLAPQSTAETAQNSAGRSNATTQESDQNHFVSLFYEHYAQWLVAPFQYTVVVPLRRMPDSVARSPETSAVARQMEEMLKRGVSAKDELLQAVPQCSNRGSFALELLNFCVRAHLYRMKFFLLRSRILGHVTKLLHPTASMPSGDRCLKLAALRLIRSILSVKDEFYHRHIIQHDLFAPVFEAFRANPVGDNLVSSAIVEICDFIQNQNIKSLLEYIVTRHLASVAGPDGKSLEDVALPYVSTFSTLRKAYEENLNAANNTSMSNSSDRIDSGSSTVGNGTTEHSRFFSPTGTLIRNAHLGMSEKALEDQRKFGEANAEESYFDADDDDEGPKCSLVRPAPTSPITNAVVDEVDATERAASMAFISNSHLLNP